MIANVSVVEAVARVLELLVFAGANFTFAAGLRAWFRWPRLRERTAACVVAGLLAAPALLPGVVLRDAGFIAYGALAFAANYVAILAGLRFVRPSPSY
jgi:hypothetical protein